jgi:hypothetical protein
VQLHNVRRCCHNIRLGDLTFVGKNAFFLKNFSGGLRRYRVLGIETSERFQKCLVILLAHIVSEGHSLCNLLTGVVQPLT